MELDCYRNFLAVVEAGSFTGAAECVHIAQPALSKQLRHLENYFGAKLIISTRGSRQLLLTEAGRVLYQKAKYICSKFITKIFQVMVLNYYVSIKMEKLL